MRIPTAPPSSCSVYMNRNFQESLDVPVGPNNHVDPGGPDRGQPTAVVTFAKEKPPLEKAEFKAPPGSTVTAKFSTTATFKSAAELAAALHQSMAKGGDQSSAPIANESHYRINIVRRDKPGARLGRDLSRTQSEYHAGEKLPAQSGSFLFAQKRNFSHCAEIAPVATVAP